MQLKRWAVILSAAVLAACGGDGDSSSSTTGGASGSGSESKSYTLKPQAVVLDPNTISIGAMDDTSLVLTGATSGISVGQILISSEGNGFLRKVLSVEQTTNGVKLRTEQAGLAEAFSHIDISLDKVFGPSDFGQTIPTGTPELELSFRNSTAKSTEISGPELSLDFKKFGLSGNSGIEIDGNASFRLAPQFDLKLQESSNNESVLTYRFALNPNYRHSLSLKSKYGGAISMKEGKDIRLGRFVIPGTPIVVVPTLIVEAGVQGQAAGATGTTYTASVSGSAYIQRDVTGQTTTGTTYQPLQTGTFGQAESTLSLGVTPASVKIEFRLYDIAGPNFALAANGELSGTLETNTQTGEEGIRAKVVGKLQGSLGFGGHIPVFERFFKDIKGGFSIASTPLFTLERELANEFFPFSGVGAITVLDSGNVPDDIFEVALDGLVLGRTTKGGSGQFRMSSLRPGQRQLTVTTVEDDAPPGTYTIQLNEGLTFEDGTTSRRGGLSLGSSLSLTVNVPSRSN